MYIDFNSKLPYIVSNMKTINKRLEAFMSNLDFDTQSDFNAVDVLPKFSVDYIYKIRGISCIYFKYIPPSSLSEDLLELHRNVWNENKTEAFVVISDNKTLLCASRYKPDENNPFNCEIKDFSYGVNSPGFKSSDLEPLLKENIDYGFFWNFVRERIKERKKQSVDFDLLLNLIELKKDLCTDLEQEKIYILIERCLFLKYLEDREFSPKTLLDILKSKKNQKLNELFLKVKNSLKGNIFDGNIFNHQEITDNTINKLYNFFTKDYRNRQSRLFPYKFDIIPVELLSNIYEAFLKTGEQASNGIYYTPSILVELVLNDTLVPKLKKNTEPTCLDFACGSGIFLVKSFEKIIETNNCHNNFERKKDILKNCIFGVEKDPVATRITIFSLYLILLDGEDSEKMMRLIKSNRVKFPKLLNKNILNKDTLFDELNFVNENGKSFKSFDIVVGNPPWGLNLFRSIKNDKKMKLSTEKQKVANEDQSSQCFILKSDELMKSNSLAGFVSNSSNFLMTKAKPFRNKILNLYNINTIYELTQYNPILFEKRLIGDLKLGANEPAVAFIFKKKKTERENIIKYVTPSLDLFSKSLRIFVIKSSNIKYVSQNLLLNNDLLWRILAVGDLDDFRLIKKLEMQNEIELKGAEGFSATTHDEYKMLLENSDYVDKDCISPFVFLKNQIKTTPNNGIRITRRRGGCNPDTKEYEKRKLLIKRYVEKDLRIKAVYDNNGYKYKNNLLAVFSDFNYHQLLSFFNSSLVSYFLFYTSSQIGKDTYGNLQTKEIANVPVPLEKNIPAKFKKKLANLTEKILEAGKATPELIDQIDEAIFNIYHLKEFEKQRIRDFFNVHNRIDAYVTKNDLQRYVNRFRDVFRFILKDDKYLNAEVYISTSFGSGITFELTDISEKKQIVGFNEIQDINKLIRIVTKKQIGNSQRNSLLTQEKVKIYNKQKFAIIKSNQFKDWTETEAIKDAKEEIELFIKQLPKD